MGSWTELAIEVAAPAAEVLADAVGALTDGVEIRDAETIIRMAAGRALIVAQCAPELEAEVVEAVQDACVRLRAAGVSPDPVDVRRRVAHEDEWRDVWKRYFRAQRVGRTFLIRPSWEQVPATAADRVIDIDPGRAFGTGGHASTRLVIAMTEELAEGAADVTAGGPASGALQVQRFLDLGCGSGILSIAAARLWPSARGLAIDVDPEAVATAGENFERNGITTVERRVGTLDDAAGPSDLVLANIEAHVLIPLAPRFPAKLARGGVLILSGLLASDVEAVTTAYQTVGLQIESRRDEQEWAALRLRAR
jgi:ribosomal protein L11 methyltransferase